MKHKKRRETQEQSGCSYAGQTIEWSTKEFGVENTIWPSVYTRESCNGCWSRFDRWDNSSKMFQITLSLPSLVHMLFLLQLPFLCGIGASTEDQCSMSQGAFECSWGSMTEIPQNIPDDAWSERVTGNKINAVRENTFLPQGSEASRNTEELFLQMNQVTFHTGDLVPCLVVFAADWHHSSQSCLVLWCRILDYLQISTIETGTFRGLDNLSLLHSSGIKPTVWHQEGHILWDPKSWVAVSGPKQNNRHWGQFFWKLVSGNHSHFEQQPSDNYQSWNVDWVGWRGSPCFEQQSCNFYIFWCPSHTPQTWQFWYEAQQLDHTQWGWLGKSRTWNAAHKGRWEPYSVWLESVLAKEALWGILEWWGAHILYERLWWFQVCRFGWELVWCWLGL